MRLPNRPLRLSLRQLVLITFILLIGFELHIIDVGAAPLQGDEVWLSYLAYNFGHNGQRSALGVASSAGVNQPPFFSDVFAIPYMLTPDPRVARFFMAALQLLGAAALYRTVRRYWSPPTPTVALVLYTVMPRAIWAGRFLWNPYLAIPFIIGFLSTGLLLAEGKRWARWLHFPLLACAIGAHPIMGIIGIVSIGFLARDWLSTRHLPHALRAWLIDYAVSISIALLVLSPWAIGLLQQHLTAPDQGAFRQRQRTSTAEIARYTIDAPTSLDLGAFVMPALDYVDPPPVLTAITQLVGWFSLLGSFFLVGRALWYMNQQRRQRVPTVSTLQSRFPDLMIGLAYLVPPAVLLLSPTRTYDQYLVPLVPTAAVIQAIFLVGGRAAADRPRMRPGIWRTVAFGVGVLIGFIMGTTELAITINAMQQVHDLKHFEPGGMPSLAEMVRVRDAAVVPGKETIYLVDSGSATAFEQGLLWLTLANKGPSRVIWGDIFSLPVPSGGATYVGYVNAQIIPELYTTPAPRLIADNLYRVVDLPPNSGFTPTCRADKINGLANGATILGYYVPKVDGIQPLAAPARPWTIYVLWRSRLSSEHSGYQLFSHLVDAQGTKYAQNDQETLATDLWREGDLLVNKVTLVPNAALPLNQPLFLRIGMYMLPTATHSHIINSNAVDQNGNLMAGWVTIPVCAPLGWHF